MAKLNIGSESCWDSTSRVTTPSIVISKENETTKYIPLFKGSKNSEVQSGNYYYKLGSLTLSKDSEIYRACISARYNRIIADVLSTTITHSGNTSTSTTYTTETQTGTISQYCYPREETYFNVTFNPAFAETPEAYIMRVNADGTPWVDVDGNASTWYSPFKPNDYSSYKNATKMYWMVYAGKNQGGTRYFAWKATGTVAHTTTTYPSETKSSTASKQVNYGITFPNAPSTLTVNNGCTVANNIGNASCTVSKSLSGTVAYNQSATLTQDFNVTVNGNI